MTRGAVRRPVPQPETLPGSVLLREIREQPAALSRLVEHSSEYAAVARVARARDVKLVRLVGHGSSDNAASYGVYAFGLLPGWTALRDSISLSVYYGAETDLRGSCVVALSQSGQTPDVLEYVERARARGAFTIALTNESGSPLADAADAVLPLGAGVEEAIAATKTYTAQVAALAVLAGYAADDGERVVDGIREVTELVADVLPDVEQRLSDVAVALAFVGRMFVIGRGPEFATAREISLKLLETCRVAAAPLTATDLVHGPVAALDGLFPVWTIAPDDALLPVVREAAARAHAAGATLLVSGTGAAAIADGDYYVPVPKPSLPLLAPLISVVPGQVLAWALAQAKGLDPDRPNGLTKVTLVP
ncbi:MAG TPA: SIS domain-containing protein [Gaiellaceae bacterium]|nr:SIS domain-containing protein [Gaiellaceae bacterium]